MPVHIIATSQVHGVLVHVVNLLHEPRGEHPGEGLLTGEFSAPEFKKRKFLKMISKLYIFISK